MGWLTAGSELAVSAERTERWVRLLMRARVGVLSNCQRGVGSWRQAWRAGGLAAERQPPHVVAGVCARTQGTPTDASTSNRQEVVDWSTIRSAHGRVCQSHGRHLHGHLNGSGAIVEGGIKQTGKFNPWSGSSPIAELLLQLAKKVSPASFSTGLALGCVDSLRPQGTQG